jgi:uncharacterized protein (DUF433 family)
MIDEAIDTVKAHIVRTPGMLGGKPRIAGHRIAVQHVVIWHERLGMSVDDIANEYELTPADIYAALTYYHDHQDEINAAIHAEEMLVTEMQQRYPSKLKAKLSG